MNFNVCKICGSHLDPGEQCDCQKSTHEEKPGLKANDLLLNQSLIDRCNNVSNFNSGDNIAHDAHVSLKKFDELISKYADVFNPEQQAYAAQRRSAWTGLVADVYNDELSRRANYVPITVAGASNYPANTMRKRLESIQKGSEEGAHKLETFLFNTEKGIKNLIRPKDAIAAYRTGKCTDPIQSDDDYAIEKLTAKFAYLSELQNIMKAANAYYRKNITLKGCEGFTDEQAKTADAKIAGRHSWERCPYPAYLLSNNNAMIKATHRRLADLGVGYETA